MKNDTKHRQTSVIHPLTKELLEVDEKMAPLLRVMWAIGVTTTYSCQGDGHLYVDQNCYEARGHRAYVQMRRDAWSLGFIKELFSDQSAFASNMASWTIDFDENPKTHERRITVRFPSADINKLIDLIEGWN